MNHLWFGKSLKDAIATPIVFVDDRTVVKFEPGFDTVFDRKRGLTVYKKALCLVHLSFLLLLPNRK